MYRFGRRISSPELTGPVRGRGGGRGGRGAGGSGTGKGGVGVGAKRPRLN